MASRKEITVKVGNSAIVLDLATWLWHAAAGTAEPLARIANSRGYQYSVADGEPGYLFAQQTAQLLGGEAVLPGLPLGEEGEIY